MQERKVDVAAYQLLLQAIQNESQRFQEYYLWLEKNMPGPFFEELDQESIMLVAHQLMGFCLQNHYCEIHIKHGSIVLCTDSLDSDVNILGNYRDYGVKNYRTFVSMKCLDCLNLNLKLKVALLRFTAVEDPIEDQNKEGLEQKKTEVWKRIEKKNTEMSEEDVRSLLDGMDSRFLRALPQEKLVLACDVLSRAGKEDRCQYELIYRSNWEEEKEASMSIVLAWKNTPKYRFLHKLSRIIYRHGLKIQKVNVSYTQPCEQQNILVMSLNLHGCKGKAVWDVTDLDDFLKEFVTAKYFEDEDLIEEVFVNSSLIRGNLGNLLRTMHNFIHQALVHIDAHQYTVENIVEALCRHPEISIELLKAFEARFNPQKVNSGAFKKIKANFLKLVDQLDTGRPSNDIRRKNVLLQGMNFVDHVLNTNFYCKNKDAFSFRLDPAYLHKGPIEIKEKFPTLPFAIFFVKGMHFFGFHIRFKNLARGGLRTVFPQKREHMIVERNQIFTECYNLAHTQHKKNKDIPEGGAKGIVFLKPNKRLKSELLILRKELQSLETEEIEKALALYKKQQRLEYLHQTQRAFISSLLMLINRDEKSHLRKSDIIDYWKRFEHLYLGPDENMHNEVIEWIAARSKERKHHAGTAFISSKPSCGVNHKQYGVTSLGVNTYMHAVLEFMGIDPKKENFTIKISGGPDGDVAGNQIYNLYRFYPKTAKLLAVTDASGTILDPQGLDLEILAGLFKASLPIAHYPAEKLSEGGFLLDLHKKRNLGGFSQQSLCYRKKESKLLKEWLSASEANQLFRKNLHSCVTDIFIPAGGRPRTLHDGNKEEYLDDEGRATSKAIVEGANLYLTPRARSFLESKGVIIFKDSSANKGGVICSSYEVLCGLCLGDELFVKNKENLVAEILEIIKKLCAKEAKLLLERHAKTGESLTRLSEIISTRINKFTDDMLLYLHKQPLSKNPKDPLLSYFLDHCPPTLRKNHLQKLLDNVPIDHQKAIIASRLASQIVYEKGLDWSPTLVDILPLLLQDQSLHAE